MFSIIIPAYNAESVIKCSVDSVLNQTFQNFEIIIVDDGSNDNTKYIIDQYDDSRIKYIYQENAGVSAARNKGIMNSKNKFICFLDADDEWKCNHLEELMSLIEKYADCGMYITGYDILLNNGEIIRKSEKILHSIESNTFVSNNGFDILLKYGYFLNTNTVCCRREVFEKVGFFEMGIKQAEDDDMWFRIFSFYNIAITKNSTTIYKRNNSLASKHRYESLESVFYNRVDELLTRADVLEERIIGLKKWKEHHKISKCRKCILIGRKIDAMKTFKQINIRYANKKRYLETLLCFMIPSKVIKLCIDKRDANYYG